MTNKAHLSNVKGLIITASDYIEETEWDEYKDYIDMKVELYDYVNSLEIMAKESPEELINLLNKVRSDMKYELKEIGYDIYGNKIYDEDRYYADGKLD